MTKLTHTTDTTKKDPGLLVRMADAAYRRPVTITEEQNRLRFEAKVIRMNWPELQTACKNYHGHLNQTA
jgi:hypothetical protein